MRQAQEMLREGDLEGCLGEVMQSVRADGGDVAMRILLFQLFCVTGQWERARRQLYVLKDMDAGTVPMCETYDPVIQCEMFRLAVFAGERSPLYFGQPQDWLATLASALSPLAAGRLEDSRQLQSEAFDAAPETAGTIDGKPFSWIADADGRLGPVLEVFLNGLYYWVPFNHVARITITEPGDLRDLVWTPAEFVWSNGGQAVGFIPCRYPGTESADDSRLRLSRMTDWQNQTEDLVTGIGQRLLITDQHECSLLDVREIRLGDVDESGESG